MHAATEQALTVPPECYTPSGIVPRGALVPAALCALAVLPAAWAYALVTMVAPAFVNVCALCGFGAAIGQVAAWAARRARIRNHGWITRYAVALALLAWYAHWAVWLAIAMHHQGGPAVLHSAPILALHPGAMLDAAAQVARQNAWGVGTMPMLAVWLLEAYVLLHLAPVPGQAQVTQPFCEASGTWAEALPVARKFACIAQPRALLRLLAQRPQHFAVALRPWLGADPGYAEVTLYHCRGGDPFVTIRNFVARGADRATISGTDVVVALRVPGADAHAMMAQLLARADAPVEPAATSHAGMPQRMAQSGLGTDAPVAPELSSALALYQAARFADAVARALPHVHAPAAQLRADARRLCALACTHQGRWADAVTHWQAVYDDDAAAHSALQCAGCAVLAGDRALGEQWFARARSVNEVTGELPDITLLSTFITALEQAGHAAAAMPLLAEIRACYLACGVTDPSMLYTRRMPLLHEFLERSVSIVVAVLGREQGLAWYGAMLGLLDEAGNVELSQWLDERARSLAG